MTIIATRGKDDLWRWRIVDADGRIVATAQVSETYPNEARGCWRRAAGHAPHRRQREPSRP